MIDKLEKGKTVYWVETPSPYGHDSSAHLREGIVRQAGEQFSAIEWQPARPFGRLDKRYTSSFLRQLAPTPKQAWLECYEQLEQKVQALQRELDHYRAVREDVGSKRWVQGREVTS
jgi:hypothetical protein